MDGLGEKVGVHLQNTQTTRSIDLHIGTCYTGHLFVLFK